MVVVAGNLAKRFDRPFKVLRVHIGGGYDLRVRQLRAYAGKLKPAFADPYYACPIGAVLAHRTSSKIPTIIQGHFI